MSIKPKALLLMMIIAAQLLSACGSTAAPAPAPTSTTASATIEPTATAKPIEPTAIPLTPTPAKVDHTVKIDALYYRTTNTGAEGGTSSIQVRVQPAATPGQLRVGFFQEEVAGTGQQWQSSGWIAVLLGSMLEGVNPTDYEFSFSSGGWVDGPSAGGLMTVGVLAALRGDTVRDDASMTGTINPDGTIGPVGGIPHKLDGAAKAGKKLILVPLGQRYDFDKNQQKLVDLVDAGKKMGVEVREVGTVFDAYEGLTGHTLPQPAAGGSTPQLSSRAFDRMRAKTLEWISRYQKSRNEFNALTNEVQQLVADNITYADSQAAKADSALKQGLVAVAYADASDAATSAQTANIMGQILQSYAIGGIERAIDHYRATNAVQTELKAVVAALQAEDVRTVSDVLTQFDAYSNIGIAEGLIMVADGQINDLANNIADLQEDEIFQRLATASLEYALASVNVQYARDAVDVGLGFGSTPAPAPQKILQIAEALRRAADSNMALFDSIIVNEYARQTGMHPDVLKTVMMDREPGYLFATASRLGINVLSKEIGDGPESAALIFGHSQSAYSLSSSLLAKHYSLGAQVDDDLNVVSFQREKALGEMLDYADRRARALIAELGDEAPPATMYYYELGRSLRQGSAQDQLDALNYFWQSAILAQAGVYLVGN